MVIRKLAYNRRGWIRIVEAVVAIIIVFASVLIVMSKNKVEVKNESCDSAGQYLDEIARVEKLRYAVLTGNNASIAGFLAGRIDNPAMKAEFSICNPEQSCPLPSSVSERVEVCADERIISSARGTDAPAKKIKIFLYKKQ